MSKAKAWAAHLGWGLLILVDVFGNMLLALTDWSYLRTSAWKETLSSRAGRMREKKQPAWGWTADFIDDLAELFANQADHCKTQVEREKQEGGVWAAWRKQSPSYQQPA